MSKFNQSVASEEFKRLEELQAGVNKKAVDQEYSKREIEGVQRNSDKFADNLKTDGRAQPLRRKEANFAGVREKMGKLSAVTNVMSKINWGEDGLYFVAFTVSVIGDIGTMMIGAVQAIPGGGWVLAAVFGMATQTFIFGISAVIFMLYLMNGHYKKKKAFVKVAVLMGFTFTELMPIATALPGFIGSFIINYAIVLYGRTIEDALARDKMIGKALKFVPGKNMASRGGIGARETIR